MYKKLLSSLYDTSPKVVRCGIAFMMFSPFLRHGPNSERFAFSRIKNVKPYGLTADHPY